MTSRVLVTGIPRSGKTVFAGDGALHADDLVQDGADWSDQSETIASDWMQRSGPWTIEGVAVVRALRKWMQRNEGKPADVVYWLDDPRVPLSLGQKAMARGCRTIWSEVRPELERRGVEVRYGVEFGKPA